MTKPYKSAWEIFTDPSELKIAELIQQRRYQMLIHSCIYYRLNDSYISDHQWSEWAMELKELQDTYPKISEKVTLYEYFKDWNGSSGAFLPLDLDWVIQKARDLLNYREEKAFNLQKPVKKQVKQKAKSRKLF